jgi:hypothetical protein
LGSDEAFSLWRAAMKVKVADLRRTANKLFDHLETSGHEDVEVDRDYYWSIPVEKLYAAYEQPSSFTLGQLSEDLQHLEKIRILADFFS